jgi:hypothetical protein
VPGRPGLDSELYPSSWAASEWEKLRGKTVPDRILVLARRRDLAGMGWLADQLLVANYEASLRIALSFSGIVRPKSKSKLPAAG